MRIVSAASMARSEYVRCPPGLPAGRSSPGLERSIREPDGQVTTIS